MKIKNKGKVHPSPSSSSSSSSLPSYSPSTDALSVLKLLPAAILALASVLSLEDREVLAYMITRSMKTTTSNNPSSNDSKKKCKKPSAATAAAAATHKPPVFDCDCFDCYTCYWFRWDSSPNRELIHQAIEAFEDHLTHGEQSKKNNGRAKRKEKLSRRVAEKPADASEMPTQLIQTEIPEISSPERVDLFAVMSSENDVFPIVSSEKADAVEGFKEEEADGANGELPDTASESATEVLRSTAASNNKGLARKVLPDVLGLLNSRLWNLWSPNA
ncbi:hypothetical protein L1049_007157 [Liquidambar formosana]|uniref:Uncharacterized protein n=1 Tax=Liquidambar formosana TaxID=63359 RepID=A0AAP0RGR2_LIQFO